ncbi:MAG: heavy metal sensor histidine kinase [Acidobacteria bacterium]|nr:heavy metal sensor histidine kinase [Acidobacteriota bacterium]MBI3425986.1 heavy metal sensor histidine kinase [Acidobacteriota bacterium]
MLSLRYKLALYYLVILSLVLMVCGLAIYGYISRSLVNTIDQSLDHQVQKLEQIAKLSTYDSPNDEPNFPPGGEPEAENEVVPLAMHLMQVINERGEIKTESYAHPQNEVAADLAALQRLAPDRTYHDTVVMPGGEALRLATRRTKGHDGADFYVRLGYSLAALQQARKRLLLIFGIVIPLALLLSGAGGLVLANQALRPVDSLTKAAEQIGAGDLTERVPVPEKMDELGRLASTFNHMIARLQAAFERQKQFTSDASHELRTPLAVMRGELEITLRRERSPEEYQRTLGSNLEEIIRLSRLVEDLLMLARADAGRVELRCEPVNLTALCCDTADYITPLAEQREQTLVCLTPPQTVTIQADQQRIKQLLLNLLDNAIKYTDHGGTITLSLAAESDAVVIKVADTGRGIPPEDVPHVFERFFRRSAKTSDRSASGSGLGLSIVKWIVEAHGGSIEVQSRLSEGTTFTVRFPLVES